MKREPSLTGGSGHSTGSLWACLLQDGVSTLLLLSCEEHAGVRYPQTGVAFLKVDFAHLKMAMALWVGFCRNTFDILTQCLPGRVSPGFILGEFYKAGLWPDTRAVFKSGFTGG